MRLLPCLYGDCVCAWLHAYVWMCVCLYCDSVVFACVSGHVCMVVVCVCLGVCVFVNVCVCVVIVLCLCLWQCLCGGCQCLRGRMHVCDNVCLHGECVLFVRVSGNVCIVLVCVFACVYACL